MWIGQQYREGREASLEGSSKDTTSSEATSEALHHQGIGWALGSESCLSKIKFPKLWDFSKPMGSLLVLLPNPSGLESWDPDNEGTTSQESFDSQEDTLVVKKRKIA